MDQILKNMENKLKNSFSNAKKDILDLRNETKAIKEELYEIKAILEQYIFFSSTGNKGVINNHQQSTIINTPQQTPKIEEKSPILEENKPNIPPDKEKSEFINNTLKTLKKDLEKTFKTLTDREFSIFMAICELEEQIGKVTYTDVANHLSLTEMTVRSYVSSLINKQIPIKKTRRFNNKVSLSIKQELKDLNLTTKLMALRKNYDPHQRTLL